MRAIEGGGIATKAKRQMADRLKVAMISELYSDSKKKDNAFSPEQLEDDMSKQVFL